MKKGKWSIVILWVIALLTTYVLNIFGILTSLQSGGITYYIALFCLFILLYCHYYFVYSKETRVRVRSLIKPLFQSIFLFLILLIVLSLLFPETFKASELSAYRTRFETNGYSAEEINSNMKMMEKFYYYFLIIGCLIIHSIIGFVALLVLKIIAALKSKVRSSQDVNLH